VRGNNIGQRWFLGHGFVPSDIASKRKPLVLIHYFIEFCLTRQITGITIPGPLFRQYGNRLKEGSLFSPNIITLIETDRV